MSVEKLNETHKQMTEGPGCAMAGRCSNKQHHKTLIVTKKSQTHLPLFFFLIANNICV